MKYSDVVVDWLCELGYTHCFFVAGGNIMHLLDGVRKRMTCVPFVHEVAAGIAVESFNESRSYDGPRAFAMVTAGPGLTNIITAMAGAWLESRELLVLGGQVKSTDLATLGLRQRGIQEIDGVALAAPVAIVDDAIRIEITAGYGRERPDVVDALASASILRSGIDITFALPKLARGAHRITFAVASNDGATLFALDAERSFRTL